MKALQREVWSLIFLVFGVHMVNAEEQEIQAQKMRAEDLFSNSPSGPPMEEDASLGDS